jgi:hypothetical protein
MTLDEFRTEMSAFAQDCGAEANRLKDSMLVRLKLRELYEKFDGDERLLAHQVLGEWLKSANEMLRYDALYLISTFKIEAMLPVLHEVAEQLAADITVRTRHQAAVARAFSERV